MESSLNEAHHEERKAETFLNAHRFQDAIQCHQKTVELLNEAMKLTAVERALESIRLQRDHHVHQQSVIRHKQSLYEARRALQHQRVLLKMASTAAAAATSGKHVKSKRSMNNVNKCDQDGLQLAIYRNIDDNDSLLQFLRMASQSAAMDAAAADGDGDDSSISRGLAPMVKDDKTVIEELRVNNGELRRLVDVLVADLDDSRAEVVRLGRLVHDMRLRLQELDEEATANRLPTLVTAYSSSNSPFVFSSSSSSSCAEIAETPPSSGGDGIRTHTDLPPLEMPPLIDFSRPADQQQQQPASEMTSDDLVGRATDSPSKYTSSSPYDI